MWKRIQRPLVWLMLMLLVLVLVLVSAKLSDLDDDLYAYYLTKITPEQVQDFSIWLPDYRLSGEPLVIEVIRSNASGLTWSDQTGSLFLIKSDPEEILELKPTGEVIRTITLKGFHDPEGIVWIDENRFALVKERAQSISVFEINSDTLMLDITDSKTFTLNINAGKNKGFEGLAWNPVEQIFYVAKERDPMMMLTISGLVGDDAGKHLMLSRSDELLRDIRFFNTDLSGLHFDRKSGNLLVLSDESKLLSEVNDDGDIVSTMQLTAGENGLNTSISQAEGVTMDSAGNLYILSEPNLLFVFSRQ